MPRIRHLWKVKARGENPEDLERSCLTCGLDTDQNSITYDRCRYIDPSFSRDCSSVIIQCLGTANKAPISLSATLDLEKGQLNEDSIFILEDNSKLTENLEDNYGYRDRTFGSIKLETDEENEYFYSLYYPPNFKGFRLRS